MTQEVTKKIESEVETKKKADEKAKAEVKAANEKRVQEQKENEQIARSQLTHREDQAGIKMEVSSLDDSFLTEPSNKEEKVIVKSPQAMTQSKSDESNEKKNKEKGKSGKDYEIVTSKVDGGDESKYVVPLKLPKEPEPKKEEEAPKPEKKKKLIAEKED